MKVEKTFLVLWIAHGSETFKRAISSVGKGQAGCPAQRAGMEDFGFYCGPDVNTAREFIETLERRMPFGVRALQVDGGPEFYPGFEECCRRKIQLFLLPPKSSMLNGSVERAHLTHTEEFYVVYDCPWSVSEFNKELRQWEYIHNCVRLHQALNY